MDDERDETVDRISRRVEQRARRRASSDGVWFGVSTFGIVGWSVAIPTLIGLAVGIWIDRHVDSQRSWTLALLFAGITLGCLNAWYWVAETHKRANDRDAEEQTK